MQTIQNYPVDQEERRSQVRLVAVHREGLTMARFSPRRLHFGRRPEAEGDDDGLGLLSQISV